MEIRGFLADKELLYPPDVSSTNSSIKLQIAGKWSNFGKTHSPLLSSLSLDIPLTPHPDFPMLDLDHTKLDGSGFVFPCRDVEDEGGIGNIDPVPDLSDEAVVDWVPSPPMTPTSPPASPDVPAVNGFFPQITAEENGLSTYKLFSALTDCQGKQKRCLEASVQALADEDEAWIQQLIQKTPKGSVLLISFKITDHGLDPIVIVVPERDPEAPQKKPSMGIPSLVTPNDAPQKGKRKRKAKEKAKSRGEEKEKKYLCDECGVRFGTQFSKKRHLKTHRGVKELVCTFDSECKRRFSEKSALKRHLQSHAKSRPFVCPNCSRPYADRVNLHKHLASQTCHGIPGSPRRRKRPQLV